MSEAKSGAEGQSAKSETPSDNTVSLDDLLAEAAQPTQSDGVPADVDALLAQSDPAFAQRIASLKQEVEAQPPEFVPQVDLTKKDWREQLGDVGRGVLAALSFLKRRPPHDGPEHLSTKQRLARTGVWLVQAAKGSLRGLRVFLAALLRSAKELSGAFVKLSWADRGKVLAICLLLFLSGLSIQLLRSPPTFPDFKTPTITGFDQVATRAYSFDPSTELEEFDSPLRQPEHVVLIDQFVVNLRRVRANSNPMGYFGFYIEAVSREAAIEIKDRQREAKDLMQRLVEQATHGELESTEGKERLKREIRRVLNEEFLTTGRVRSVYFQQFLLKE